MTPSSVNFDGKEALLQTPTVLTYNRSFVETDSCFGSLLAERAAPKCAEIGSKCVQVSPKSVQVGPKSAQVGPKSVQVGPKSSQVAPKSSPKRLQVEPKRCPRLSKLSQKTLFKANTAKT